MRFASRSAELGAALGLLVAGRALAATPFVETLQPKSQHAASGLHPLQLEAMMSVRPTFGRADAYGVYTANPAGMSAWSTATLLSAAYRFNPFLEAYGRAVVGRSWTSSSTGYVSSDIVGLPAVEARFHLPPSLTPFRAHAIVYGGYTFPYAYSNRRQNGDAMRDVDTDELGGDGSFTGECWTVGTSVSRAEGPLRAAISFSTSFPVTQTIELPEAPRGTPRVNVQRGAQLQSKEGLSWVFNPTWTLGGALRQEWGLGTHVDGDPVDATATRRFTSILAGSYSPAADWRWGASFETPFPFETYLTNRTNAPTLALTLTYLGL